MPDETYAELHVSHEPNPTLWLVLNTPKKSAMFNLNNVACERRGVFIEAVGAIIQHLDGDGGGRYVLTTAPKPSKQYEAMKEDRDRLQGNVNALREAQTIILDEHRVEVAALKRRIDELEGDLAAASASRCTAMSHETEVAAAIAAERHAQRSMPFEQDTMAHESIVGQVVPRAAAPDPNFKCRCKMGRRVDECPGNVCGGDVCKGQGRYHNDRFGVSVCDDCHTSRSHA